MEGWQSWTRCKRNVDKQTKFVAWHQARRPPEMSSAFDAVLPGFSPGVTLSEGKKKKIRNKKTNLRQFNVPFRTFNTWVRKYFQVSSAFFPHFFPSSVSVASCRMLTSRCGEIRLIVNGVSMCCNDSPTSVFYSPQSPWSVIFRKSIIFCRDGTPCVGAGWVVVRLQMIPTVHKLLIWLHPRPTPSFHPLSHPVKNVWDWR